MMPTRSHSSSTSSISWLDSRIIWPPTAQLTDQRAHIGLPGRIQPIGPFV
jgi:hypothetical protein